MSDRGFAERSCCLLLSAVSLALARPASAQAPRLEHTAPFLGQTLELRVEAAAAGAKVVLLRSARPAHIVTPWGTLELERANMQVAAVGQADASGACTLLQAVPLDPELAEVPAHYQALILPPGGSLPALSEAVHLRFLGTRAYVPFAGLDDPNLGCFPGGLSILSLVSNALVATVEYDAPCPARGDASAEPVFAANYGRGAMMATSGELYLFDPFFGRVLARASFTNASRKLLTDRARSRIFVLDSDLATGAHVHVLDFDGLAPLAEVALPAEGLSSTWIAARESSIAYVVGREPSGQGLFLRRFDLETAQPLARVDIGLATSRDLRALCAIDDMVLAACDEPGPPFGNPSNGVYSRVFEESAGARVATTPGGGYGLILEPAPALGVLAVRTMSGWGPYGSIGLERLRGPTGPTCGLPGGYDYPGWLAAGPTGLWVICVLYDDFDAAWLRFHDLRDGTYRDLMAVDWHFDLPVAMRVVADVFGERVCVAAEEFIPLPNWLEIRPRVTVVDAATDARATIATGPQPEGLLLVPLP